MSFTKNMRDSANEIWLKEQNHPFVVELGTGGLKLEIFQHYMKQDYQFLIEFSKVIALAVAKCDRLSDMEWFAKLLNELLVTMQKGCLCALCGAIPTPIMNILKYFGDEMKNDMLKDN